MFHPCTAVVKCFKCSDAKDNPLLSHVLIRRITPTPYLSTLLSYYCREIYKKTQQDEKSFYNELVASRQKRAKTLTNFLKLASQSSPGKGLEIKPELLARCKIFRN